MTSKLKDDMQKADDKFKNYNKEYNSMLERTFKDGFKSGATFTSDMTREEKLKVFNSEPILVYRVDPNDSHEVQEKTLDSILGNMTKDEFKIGDRVMTEEQLLLAINFMAKD